jgi:bacterial/archaeal transporter family-2 protein
MEKLYWIILVIIAGACLPIQAGFNVKVGKVIVSPIHASFLSFAVGAIALLFYILVTKQHFNSAEIVKIPSYAYTAGILGAFYVVIALMGYKKLGVPVTFGLIVLGQMTMSLFLDHTKLLVAVQHSINTARIVGVLLIVSGVILIRKF